MPKIFEYFGLIFLFYSNEHEPIHVHVMKNGQETVFEILLQGGELSELRIRNSNKMPSLSDKDQAIAEAFVRKYYKNIVSTKPGLTGYWQTNSVKYNFLLKKYSRKVGEFLYI